MPDIVREETGNLTCTINITLTKDDYLPKLEAALKNYKKKANLKGFRKGRVPTNTIKKMYGNGILAEVINEKLQSTVSDYLTEEKLEILGQPLPAETEEILDFDIFSLGNFNFKFELGLAPEFEVQGMSSDTVIETYELKIEDELIDKEIDNLRSRQGERASVEGPVEAGDMIEFNAEELEEDKLKENGWASTFSILVDTIPNEELKAQILGANKGDKVRFDIYQLEQNNDEKHIRKYLLNVTDEDEDVAIGNLFEGTINDITRNVPAELNQAFFDKAFGEGTINSEEEARAKIEEGIRSYYDKQMDNLANRKFQDQLMEANPLDFPNEFLKKWLKFTNTDLQDDQLDTQFDSFIEGLKWTLIRGKIIKKFNLEVSDDEIFEAFKNRIRDYFQGYGDELVVLNTANRLMEDEQQVDQMYRELMSSKIFEFAKETAQLSINSITTEEFNKMAVEMQQKNAPAVESPASDSAESEAEETVAEDVTEDVEP